MVALPLTVALRAKQVSRLPASKMPKPYAAEFTVPKPAVPVAPNRYEIVQQPFDADIVPNLGARMWGYNGIVPGPTIRAQKGRRSSSARSTRCRPCTRRWVHARDLGPPARPRVAAAVRRLRQDITAPGQFKDYLYPNGQDERTLWYHDHGVHHTAENIYMGLAGHVPS